MKTYLKYLQQNFLWSLSKAYIKKHIKLCPLTIENVKKTIEINLVF